MSLVRPTALRTSLLAASRPLCLRSIALRYSSTSASEATVLPRLQSDLKDAMRAKNKPALNTIRALQAEIINASKTDKPIINDGTFYLLVQKQIKASTTAMEEFQAAKRDDLVDKEQAQLEILNKYADEIPKVSEGEIDEVIESVLGKLDEKKRSYGSVMGKVMDKLKGRAFVAEDVSKKVSGVIGTDK